VQDTESVVTASTVVVQKEDAIFITDEELTDMDKNTCLLCQRAFWSKEILMKHQQTSELHKVCFLVCLFLIYFVLLKLDKCDEIT